MTMTYSISDFRRDIRQPYAWPGGYPRYFICDDGEALSFDSAKANKRLVLESLRDCTNDGWRILACDINYEDETLTCCHSGESIPSAYGETPEVETLPVMFRKSAGEVTAVFPTLPADYVGNLTCYAHIGQHGSCSAEWLRSTRPASESEVAPLLAELRRIYEIGDDAVQLQIVKRRTAAHRKALEEARRESCRSYKARNRTAPTLTAPITSSASRFHPC